MDTGIICCPIRTIRKLLLYQIFLLQSVFPNPQNLLFIRLPSPASPICSPSSSIPLPASCVHCQTRVLLGADEAESERMHACGPRSPHVLLGADDVSGLAGDPPPSSCGALVCRPGGRPPALVPLTASPQRPGERPSALLVQSHHPPQQQQLHPPPSPRPPRPRPG